MSPKNLLKICNSKQSFTFTASGEPVPLDGASVSFQFWKGGAKYHTATSDSGEVTVDGDGMFSLSLSEPSQSKARECDTYTVIAYIPDIGIIPITKGPVG